MHSEFSSAGENLAKSIKHHINDIVTHVTLNDVIEYGKTSSEFQDEESFSSYFESINDENVRILYSKIKHIKHVMRM